MFVDFRLLRHTLCGSATQLGHLVILPIPDAEAPEETAALARPPRPLERTVHPRRSWRRTTASSPTPPRRPGAENTSVPTRTISLRSRPGAASRVCPRCPPCPAPLPLYLPSLAIAEKKVATITRGLVAICRAHKLHAFPPRGRDRGATGIREKPTPPGKTSKRLSSDLGVLGALAVFVAAAAQSIPRWRRQYVERNTPFGSSSRRNVRNLPQRGSCLAK